MEKHVINQNGPRPLYVEKNNGTIYVGDYVEEASSAFKDGSFELYEYAPKIDPPLKRPEVGLLKEWLAQEALSESSSRLALLYGKAGIGKSVVMHDLLVELQKNPDYLVLGLKSDQIEFVDTNELSRSLHLAQPLEVVVKEMAQQYKRVVLLIDQIDALSLSLSSNRTPLRSLLKLIRKIQLIPNVRIIISCRPYDLEYDPLLDNLNIKQKWELKEFCKEQVLRVLKAHQIKDRLNDNLIRFLGNPLHLYLFLKIRPEELLTDPLSTDLLYHQLWRKYVTDDSERKVDKQRLLALLDALVTTMYDRQELSVHIRTYETEYSTELQYLFTNEILLLSKSGQIQFFHQTLFDYVYARRFTEKGQNLLDVLKKQHQGLFSRAAVKSILTFQREQNTKEYIKTIDQLLYAKDENGKDIYRYHLKSLALSNMAYFEKPLPEELNLISRKVFMDKVYMNVLFESIYTPHWFNAIWCLIDETGGWKALDNDYKEKVMQMCRRTLWLATEDVLATVERELDCHNTEDCKYLADLLEYYELNCGSERLIGFYNKLVKSRLPLEHIHLLKNIMRDNPAFVCQELKENMRLQLVEKETKYIHRIGFSHEVENLYEELLKNHHDEGVQLLVDILTMVYEKTKFRLDGAEIYNSSEFFSFQKTTGGHFVNNFVEDAANILIDDFLSRIDDEKTKHYIMSFSKSEYEGFVFIALYVFTERPEKFKDEVYDIIMNRSVLSNAPSWVEYQTVEALEKSWGGMSDEQKKAIIDRILAIDDLGEHLLFKDAVEMRLQYGHPLLDIDLHKGKALEIIPIDELRRLSWFAYQERQRIDRKFNSEHLKNGKPSSMSSHSGWTSLREDQGLKMNNETWLNSMRTYDKNPFEWDKPSLTGQCHLFRNVVSKEPDKFLELIHEAIKDDCILLAYPQAGMQGLLDAGRKDEAMQVLQEILEVIGYDVNSTVRGFSLHSLLFALNDIAKTGPVPEIVFALFCNAVLNAKEPEEDTHQAEKDVYNVGMNQSRGNAGYMLVECAREEKYGEQIFSTFEQIAETSSVYTRGAVLLNMAALNFVDKDRNVRLFKKLLYDYNPRLMAMPVHNYNPLVYFVNYAASELMDFFQHAADCPECYREQVIILWLAWSHNNHDEHIKVLLDKMCDNSEDARISLMEFFCTLNEKMGEDAVCYIMHFMAKQFDSPRLGEVCDNLFHYTKNWPEDITRRVAEAYVSSPLSKHKTRTFIGFLAGYAIVNPIQTLIWLELVMGDNIPNEYHTWNNVVDVIIQSYNGIKQFNDSSCQDALENAMDLIDTIMQNPSNKNLIGNFINKLDNE